MSKRDYYDILEVTKASTDQEIKSSYRRLALKHHPDRNPGDKTAEEKFKEAAEAYAILSDGEKRARYDRFGHQGVGGGSQGFDPSQFTGFEDIFGGLGDIFGFGGSNQIVEECGHGGGSTPPDDVGGTFVGDAQGEDCRMSGAATCCLLD